ncbi:DUF3683 domain-containing protein [bacterium]|nr:DUF3683 domain-containing protein [bacterium]
MTITNRREIPFNYTSADDEQIIRFLLGGDCWDRSERLRSRRITGRSAKLMMRFLGDIFILNRNPFLYQDLLDSTAKRKDFLAALDTDLKLVEISAGGNEDVEFITSRCRDLYKKFKQRLDMVVILREKLQAKLGPIVGKKNIFFDPLTLVSHVTDATDWRLYLPLAVIRPTDEEQVAPLISALSSLELGVIPRGAGTGLTGGAVPVGENIVIINVEKLNRIRGIVEKTVENGDNITSTLTLLELESGVITGDAMEFASDRNLVFATDPTSSWACTIGGNIAENAGGKTAVLWGTAIDNVYSYKMAMPDGNQIEVCRLDHPCRKILPDDIVRFQVKNLTIHHSTTITMRGDDVRKKGLWKDITNKCLGNLPGIQKEGTDGIITSARFILHQAYAEKRTCCIEFFGKNFDEAGEVILEISKSFVNRGEEALFALEHFDEEYVKAIQYKVKSAKREVPKAVLLIDIVGHTPEQVTRGVEKLNHLLEGYNNTFIYTASNREEANRYWQDRKRLGAIASRTNAFKLNEDVVLPLDKISEFTRFIENTNIEEERYNQTSLTRQLQEYLETAEPLETPEWLAGKNVRFTTLCQAALDEIFSISGEKLRSRSIVKTLETDLLDLVRGYKQVRARIEKIISEVRSRLIVIATHMHAGDGNVHVNIPVFSNDREMMERAKRAADIVMDKSIKLGGVVSGEHGIGITKLKYLDQERLDQLAAYRKTVDPKGLMNPGKLSDPNIPNQVFTPSFNLLELEARILQKGSLEKLSENIAKCIRCGKCKPDCCVFYPAANLFFHPRNKNLAIGSLIEALLYTAQRSHSTRFESLKQLEDIADHCTICHKCAKPCPVDIDTGEVSILEREILSTQKFKHTPLATKMSLGYLESRSPLLNSIFKKAILRGGSSLQRLGSRVMAPLLQNGQISPGSPFKYLHSPMTPAAAESIWDILPTCEENQALVISPLTEPNRAVFYFPGCGSERLFSDIAKAAVYILLKIGLQVVLPPPYLCCGFPAKVNAKTDSHTRITLRNSILFSQISKMFNYLNLDACLVSCGTCMEALIDIGGDSIFKAPIEDVSRFVVKNGLSVDVNDSCLYHTPCHDSLKGTAAALFQNYGVYNLVNVPHCCSEAGTMALSRPDITDSLRQRKAIAIEEAMSKTDVTTTLLTNCPSCLQGLGRNSRLKVQPRHIAVDLAMKAGGENWSDQFQKMLNNVEVVRF